ncbi:MAG: hypothetical protein U5K77_00550 [Candidatus Saccharibacteria bacterium]|nr:hypothetical protein [Candidatus Saccharibacteria bacterium]
MGDQRTAAPSTAQDQSLRSLAEQLKTPLLHISQASQLARGGDSARLNQIELIADSALQFVDSYVLSTQIASGQLALSMEPVTVSSVLQDAAHKLDKIAREYACNIELKLAGKYGPVMTDRRSFESAITALGYSFIEAQAQNTDKKSRLVLSAHRGKGGIVAGAFGELEGLSSAGFRKARALQTTSRQPLPAFGHSASTGVFVADTLFEAMSSELKVTRRGNLTGLAATLSLSPQLELVAT